MDKRNRFELIDCSKLSEQSDSAHNIAVEKYSKLSGPVSDLFTSFPRGMIGIFETVRKFDLSEYNFDTITTKFLEARYKRVEGDSRSTDLNNNCSSFIDIRAARENSDNFKIHQNLYPIFSKALSERMPAQKLDALNIYEAGRYMGRLFHYAFDNETAYMYNLAPLGYEDFYASLFGGYEKIDQLGDRAKQIYYQRVQPERFAAKMGEIFLKENGYNDDEIATINCLMYETVMSAVQEEGLNETLLEELGAVYPIEDREFAIILSYLEPLQGENETSSF